VARGVAALGVVTFHWSHFFQADPLADPGGVYPFQEFLSFIYARGMFGVDFFFALSGAIFFTKYAAIIAERKISGWRFSALRFSRLYPLHFATLIAVAILQITLARHFGHFVLYDSDAAGFVSSLLFLQGLWVPIGVPFNAPARSLTIEAFLYVLFFWLARSRWDFPLMLILLAGLGLVCRALAGIEDAFGRGLWCFFIGGLAAQLYLSRGRGHRGVIAGIAIAALAAMSIWQTVGSFGNGVAGYAASTAFFGPLIVALMLAERHLPLRRIAVLGDMSYSIYLMHFPLQLMSILAVVVIAGTYSSAFFLSPWTFGAFFIVLMTTAFLIYKFFEMPAQRILRRRLLAVAASDTLVINT
jgi:peptidoglycan/LPS O-acetylase OafA/YrhL